MDWPLPTATAGLVVSVLLGLAGLLWTGGLQSPQRRRFTRRRRRILGGAVFLASCGFLFLHLTAISGAPDEAKPNPEPLTTDWKLVNVATGETTSLFAIMQGKVTLINLWATWCGPCLAEMPSFARLAEHFKDEEGLALVFIAQDRDLNRLTSYLRESKTSLPIYVPAEPAPPRFQAPMIPVTWIFGRTKVLAVKPTIGSKEWDDPKTVEQLRRLLRQTS